MRDCQTVTAREASRNFADLTSRSLYRGERFVITRSGRPIAAIVPAEDVAGPSAAEVLQALRDALATEPNDAPAPAQEGT